VLQLVATFFLVAVVTTLDLGSDGSTVFFALVGSVGMLLAYANCNPYVDYSEDLLAQALQLFITYVLAIGLLSLAGTEDSGVIMTIAAAIIFIALAVLLFFEMNFFLLNFYPTHHAKLRHPWNAMRVFICPREQPVAETIAPVARVGEGRLRKTPSRRNPLARQTSSLNRLTMAFHLSSYKSDVRPPPPHAHIVLIHPRWKCSDVCPPLRLFCCWQTASHNHKLPLALCVQSRTCQRFKQGLDRGDLQELGALQGTRHQDL
jgi:hypothetical protein